MRNYRPQVSNKQYYFLNYRIPATDLRVLDAEGAQLGVLSRDDAVKKAHEMELDLVLIAPKAKPPVAKITDFKKFLYEQGKKAKEAKKGTKKSVVKDIKLSLFIGPADLSRMIEKCRSFLDAGSQVRINLTLKGREVMKREMAFDLMKRFIADIGESNLSKEPRLEGRVIRAVVSPKK